jgi:hypothetical protein
LRVVEEKRAETCKRENVIDTVDSFTRTSNKEISKRTIQAEM